MSKNDSIERSPLLSISVPTYNRHQELSDLVDTFLHPLLETCPAKTIDVTIYDNSDAEISKLNQSILNDKIHYQHNLSNIGFARNVSQCINKAKGKFVWILPDNDFVFTDKFLLALNILIENQDEIDCLFLNWLTMHRSDSAITRPVSLPNHLFHFKEFFLNEKTLPFVLLSHAFVRKKPVPNHPAKLLDPNGINSFRQILEYLPMLSSESTCLAYAEPIMAYNVEYSGRFNARNLYSSMEIVRQYLTTREDLVSKPFLVQIQQSEYRSYVGHILLASSTLYRQKLESFTLIKALKVFPNSSKLDLKLYILLLCCIMPSLLRHPIANLYANRRSAF